MTTVSTIKYIIGADPSQVIDATRRVRFAFTGLQRDLSGFTSKYKQIQSEAIEGQTTALRKQAKEIEKLAKETHSANIKKIKEASDYYKKDNIDRYSAEAKRVKSIMALEATKSINLSKSSLHQKHLEIDAEKAKQQAKIQGLAKERSTMIAVRKDPMADVTGPGLEKIQDLYDKVDRKIQPLIDRSNKKFDNQIRSVSTSVEKAANLIQKKFVAPQTKSLLRQRTSAMKEVDSWYKSQANKEKLISSASVAQGRPDYGKQRLLAFKQERDQRKAMVEESFQIEKNKIESTSQFALNNLQKQSSKKIDTIEQNRKKEQDVIGSLSQHKGKALDKEIENHNKKLNDLAGFQAETDNKTQKVLLDNINKTYKEKKKMASDLSDSEQTNIKAEADKRKQVFEQGINSDIESFKRRANSQRNAGIKDSGQDLKTALQTTEKLKEQANVIERSKFAWLKQLSPIKMVEGALAGLMAVAKSAIKMLFSIPALIGTVVLFAIGKSFIDTAANMEKLEMALEQLTFGKGKETFLALNKWAKDMPVDTEKAISSFRLLKAYGLDPTLQDMTVLVDTVSALGGETDTLEGIARALGQIQAKGRAMQQEMNQLAERGIPALEILQQKLKLTSAEVVDVGRSPKLGSGVVLKALMEGMKERFGGLSHKFMQTWYGQMEQLKAWAMEFKRVVMDSGPFEFMKTQVQRFLSFLNSPEGLDEISKWAVRVTQFILNVFQLMAKLIKGIVSAVSWVQNTVQYMSKTKAGNKIIEEYNVSPNDPNAVEQLKQTMIYDPSKYKDTHEFLEKLSKGIKEIQQYQRDFLGSETTNKRLGEFKSELDGGLNLVEDFLRELEDNAEDYTKIRDKFFAGSLNLDAKGIGDTGLFSEGKAINRVVDDTLKLDLSGEEGIRDKLKQLYEQRKVIEEGFASGGPLYVAETPMGLHGEFTWTLKFKDTQGKELLLKEVEDKIEGWAKNQPEEVKRDIGVRWGGYTGAQTRARSQEEINQYQSKVNEFLKSTNIPVQAEYSPTRTREQILENQEQKRSQAIHRINTQIATEEKTLFESRLNEYTGLKSAYDDWLIYKKEGFTENSNDEEKEIMKIENLYRHLFQETGDAEYVNSMKSKALWEIKQKYHSEEINDIKEKVHFFAKASDNEFDVEKDNLEKRVEELRKYYSEENIMMHYTLENAKWIAKQKLEIENRSKAKAAEIADSARMDMKRREFITPYNRHSGERDIAGQVYDLNLEKMNKMKYVRLENYETPEEYAQARLDVEKDFEGKYQDIQETITDEMLSTWESAWSNMTSMMADFVENGEWSWKKFASFIAGTLMDVLKTFVETQVKMAAAERARLAASASGGGGGFNWGGLVGSIVSGLGGSLSSGVSAVDSEGFNHMEWTSSAKKYASGGMINEPVFGTGLLTGQKYTIAEQGPEMVLNEKMMSDLGKSNQNLDIVPNENMISGLGNSKQGNVLYNVNISTMDPRSMEDYFSKNPSLVLNRLHQAIQVGDKGTISTIKKASVR